MSGAESPLGRHAVGQGSAARKTAFSREPWVSETIVRPLERCDDAERRRRERWLRQCAGSDARVFRHGGYLATAAGGLLGAQWILLAAIVDGVLIDGYPASAYLPGLFAFLAVLVLRAGLGWIGERRSASAAERVKCSLRGRVYRHLLRRGPVWLRSGASGALAGAVVEHIEALDAYYTRYCPVRLEAMLVPIGLLAAVFWLDWVVGAILLLTAPLIPVFMMLVGWGAENAGRRHLEALRRMAGHFADRLRGLDTLRLYGQGESELGAIASAADGVRQRLMRVLRIAFLSSAVLEFFASISVALVALYAGLSLLGEIDVRGTPLTLGTALACLLLAPEFYAPLRRLAAYYHDRASALAAVGDLEQLLGELPSIDEAVSAPVHAGDHSASHAPQGFAYGKAEDDELPLPQKIDPGAPIGASLDVPAIIVDAVAYRPPGAHHPLFGSLSFTVPAGGRLAIRGASGCGKTTLLELLLGWRTPVEGRIRVGGVVPSSHLSGGGSIAYVGQRPFLFQGSLFDNIRMARPDASNEDVIAAAELAQVAAFARRLPEGLHTRIGERGVGLSGGEARRVGLARAILRQPDVVLLDEPTAFLDPATEAAVLRGLDRFARGRTLVMVTHSDEAARIADWSLWLPSGVMQTADTAAQLESHGSACRRTPREVCHECAA